tara:strand:- start:722 stop:871 length:150 start_codon:yes stop_codon:yes gene_type:complete
LLKKFNMKCKVSIKPIKPFILFGKMPLANVFLDKKNFKRIGGKWISHAK